MWADTVRPRGIEIITETTMHTPAVFSPQIFLICTNTDKRSDPPLGQELQAAGAQR